MKVAIGRFARSSLESRMGGDPAAAVQAALLHYARRLRSARPPVGFPRFPLDLSFGGPSLDFEVPVDPEVEWILEDEVERQGMSIDQLTAHAIFVYLADFDEVPAMPRRSTRRRADHPSPSLGTR